MTATLPTGWQGRLLALGLAFVAVALVYVLVAVPLLNLYAEQGAAAQTRRTLLLRLNAVAGELPALRARVAELRVAVDTNKVTLEGASDAIASAALQGHIEELAAAAGVTIGSTEGLPAQTQGAYRRLGLKVLFRAPYESLTKLLAALETATPPLVIDDLQVHTFQRRPGVASDSTLDASVEVYGFRANETPDSAKR